MRSEFRKNDRHHRSLAESGHHLLGGVRQKRSVACLGFIQGTGQGAWSMHCIGISEQEPFSSGFRRSRDERIIFSRPAGRKRVRIYHLYVGKGVGDFAGAVGGVVIDHDDFK